MKRLALTTALVLAVAAPAFASEQLAAQLGVDAADYSTAQLVELKSAVEAGDSWHIARIKAEARGTDAAFSTKSGPSAGQVQLAAQLGVDANAYTLSELTKLKSAVENNDASEIRAVLDHEPANTADTPSARIQLGKSVGMDPTSSSRADLVKAHSS